MWPVAPFTKLISVSCVVLALVLGLEWLALNVPSYGVKLTSSSKPGSADTELLPPAIGELREADYAEIDLRPLFIEGRMPAEVDDSAPDQRSVGYASGSAFRISLVGVRLAVDHALALVLDNKRKYHRLQIGDELQGWTLKSIKQTQVVFSREGSDKILELEKHKSVQNINNNKRRAPYRGNKPK